MIIIHRVFAVDLAATASTRQTATTGHQRCGRL